MKILYVNPSRLESGLDAIIKAQPLSLMSIAAMVPDHDAKLVDFKIKNYSEKNFNRILNKYDVVAISSLTPQIQSAFEVAEMAKKAGSTTILGGYHPTLAPEYVASHPAVDFTVRGEGEHTFKEIIDYIDQDTIKLETLKKIKGISYKRKDGNIIHNADRPLECNLDNFPIPRRDLINYKEYLYLGKRIVPLESSRGCPHSCKFCCITKMWKDPSQNIVYRTKSVNKVMEEIYNINLNNDFIFFCEDNFTIQLKRTKNILETIIKSGIPNKIYLSCQSRIDTLYRNPWLIDLMHQAGMKQIFLGIESVHQQSLDAMNKRNTTPEMTRKVVNMLHDRGMTIFGGVIIGYPGENKTMVRQTINFAKSLELTIVQFTPITAFPGTPFYDEMKKEGKITSFNPKHYNLFNTMMGTDDLTNKEIYRLVVEAYGAFYLYNFDWLKMVMKRFLNPFSNFFWMSHKATRLARQVVRGGLRMLRSQGITGTNLSEELKQIIANEKFDSFNKEIEDQIKNEPIPMPQNVKPVPVLENK
ncbi:MAG: B12-binding domain-containing radical SAM protein [Promethearchaeota archaeon]